MKRFGTIIAQLIILTSTFLINGKSKEYFTFYCQNIKENQTKTFGPFFYINEDSSNKFAKEYCEKIFSKTPTSAINSKVFKWRNI